MCLLRELRRHGVGHQWWGVLLRSLCLWEGEWGVTCIGLCTILTRDKLLGLEVVLACKCSSLVVEVGLSITIVASSTEAIAAAIAVSVATILCICAKSFVWPVVKPSTIITVPKTTEITPARISIPAVVVTTSASP